MGGGYSSPAQKISKHYASFENSLPTMQGKVVLVTGCTTGTGYTSKFVAHLSMSQQKFIFVFKKISFIDESTMIVYGMHFTVSLLHEL